MCVFDPCENNVFHYYQFSGISDSVAGKIRKRRMSELPESTATQTWQKRLLPLMVIMIAGLTIFFVVATYLQLNRLGEQIRQSPKLDLSPALNAKLTDENSFQAHWQALVILEGNALEKRYHQANVLLMSRVWIRYLGFLTGMILALIGATFVLGKLREPESSAAAEGSLWKFSMTTASPGLMLALLGTILMITAMATNPAIKVNEGRSFVGTQDTPVPGVEQ